MACEEELILLEAAQAQAPQHHHHHHHSQQFSTQFDPCNSNKPIPPAHINLHGLNSVESRKKVGEEEDYSDADFCSQGEAKCAPEFGQDLSGHHNHHQHHHHHHHPEHLHAECFGEGENEAGFRTGDEAKRAKSRSRAASRRKDRDELSDGGTYYYKKSKSSGSGGACDYKKDREEWSDSAIGCLLDAYTVKYVQLNRGNLRGRDWEEVASTVSDRCDRQKSAKSIEQCKNKVDNLKKRYKSERHRLSSGSASVSHWPWYKKMDQIVGSSASKAVSDEDKSISTAINVTRPTKRFAAVSPSPMGLPVNLKSKNLPNPRWRRVLLKISGSALAGNGTQNVDPKVLTLIAREVAVVNRLGVEVAIVVGGRNFFCGSAWVGSMGLDRASVDQIGMMATVMNSILLQASMENMGIQTRVQTAFKMAEIAEPYIRRRAVRHLEKGRVVIFGAGTGNPFFTTDTAAALRASEINAEVVLKGTNVDGIYDCDPRKNNTAILEHISYRDFAAKGLSNIMDITAITLCEDNCIPVVVFNLHEPGNISRALSGDQIGTLIDQTGKIG